MPLGWALAGSAALGFLGSQSQASAARDAASTQLQGTREAAQQQREMFDILNKQQAPYREAGYGALSKINTMLPQFTRTFTPADLTANLAPNYEFMKQQGLGATAQGANVASPGSNVDLAKTIFAEKFAQGSYQDALTNFRNQQTDIFNRLSGIAGIGQTAQGQSQNLGSATSTNLANLATGGANAIAGGQIGSANAQAAGLQGIGNSAMMYGMLSRPAVSLAT
jgi:multidrug efflux pump subunit AcrA (membrane-fusion protein)